MDYDTLLTESDKIGLTVKEKPLKYNNGRIKGNRIAIRQDIRTQTEKSCVLAEELGHYHTSYGDILDLDIVQNRKQEFRARMWGYDLKIGLTGIIRAYKKGCRNLAEMAEELDVTEEYLLEALKAYHNKYGICTTIDNYIIYFEPSLAVMKLY
jgi:hypothetical protein